MHKKKITQKQIVISHLNNLDLDTHLTSLYSIVKWIHVLWFLRIAYQFILYNCEKENVMLEILRGQTFDVV